MKFFNKTINRINNQKGFSLVEILLAAVLGAVLFGVAVMIFTKQETMLREQGSGATVRGSGRIMMSELTKQLRLAGYGIPVDNVFTTATSVSVTFRSNTDNVSSLTTNAMLVAQDTVNLVSVAGFSVGQNVWVYGVSGDNNEAAPYEIFDVDSGTQELTFTAGVANEHSATTTMVNPFHLYTYTWDSANNRVTKSVDGGTANVFLEGISGLTFVYRDSAGTDLGAAVSAANLPNIRRIEIRLNMRDTENPHSEVSLSSDVTIRNMS